MATFSGAWLTQARDVTQVPIQSDRDPQHLRPDPNPNEVGLPPDWVSTAPAPDLPLALWPDPVPNMPTGDGPVDEVDYHNTLHGPGFAPGLTELEAQDQASLWRMTDDGSYEALHWNVQPDSDSTVHLDRNPDMIGDGESPRTVQYQRTGIGQPNDPNARHADREHRWVDRPIDMHRYPVAFRPQRPRYARETPTQMTPGASQLAPHTVSIMGWDPGAPDRFVAPLVRRVPDQWDVPISSDGTAESIDGVPVSYGLGTWGL